MSQRAVFRGLLLTSLCLVSILAAPPIDAQGGPGITFSPNPVIFGLGESSPLITATIDYVSTPPTGLQTLNFNGGEVPYGITTDPSPVTFTPPAVGTIATVTFRLVSDPWAYPGASEIFVETGGVTGLLNYDLADLTVAPASISVQAGSTTGQLAATLGYDDTVPTGPQQLVFTGLPAGAVPSPSPVTFQIVQNPWAVVAFAISTSLGTPPGNYTVTVGTSPQATGTDTFVLVVTPPPAFSVVPGAAAISACPGGPAVQNSVTVTPEVGYSGSPVVTFPNLPVGLIVSPPSVPVPTLPPAQSVSFEVSAMSGSPAGPRTVNVLVQDSLGISATTSFTVNVGTPDFTPVVFPSSLSLAPGGASATVSVSAVPGVCPPYSSLYVYPSSVPRGVIVNPEGVTLEFPSYPPGTFTITATESAEPGASTIEFTYSADGGPEKTRVVQILVRAPGSLAVAAEKPTVDLCPGGPAVANSVLIEALGGYSGTPTVTFPALPAELRVTPASIPVGSLPPSRTVAFEVSAIAEAQPGAKVVNVLVSDPDGPFGVTSFVVNVGASDYLPVVFPATIELTSGGEPVAVTAGLAPGACSPPSSITVTPSGMPDGVTVTPASADLVAPSYTPVVFMFSASSEVPAGGVEVTFTFTPSTGTPKTTTTPVSVVRTGQIGVEVERAAMDVCPGGAGGTNSLTITPLDGYSGLPTVTFPTLPEGLTIVPATIPVPAMPPARTVFFDVTAGPGTPSGPATVTALVSDPRGITSIVTFIVNVLSPAFTPAATPLAVTLNAGGPASTVTASLVAGECAPTSDITVTPSGLPPGVTVTPASDAIVPPAFGPVAFSFQASSSAVPGPSTIVFTFRTSDGTARTAATVITVCGPPEAPESPVVSPQGNPEGPVTATDFLALEWGAPASGFAPTRYEWRINGGTWNSVAGTSASAPPRGAIDPVQLFVRGYACDPERGPGPESASPVYSLAAPVANFAVPASIVAGQAVTFTDTSSPQATSWLWFPGDGLPVTTVQSPTVTFSAAGPKVIVLIASNGSGSSSKTTTINVLPATAVRAATGFAVRSLEREADGRLALGRVEVESGTTLLLRRLEGEGEAVAFLRFVEADGSVVLERRLVLAAGEEARHDLSAWRVRGLFRVELVGPEGLDAAVEELSIPFGAPELPVKPRRPRSAAIR